MVLRYVLGQIKHEETRMPLKDGPVQLRVTGTSTLYRFLFSQGGEFTELGMVDAKFISSETSGGDGAFLGVFAAGSGNKSASPADFDWFEYIGK